MEGTVAADDRERLIGDFLARAGWTAAERRMLAADASFRRYDRLDLAGQKAVLMDAPPPKEQIGPFIAIARHLVALGYSAPKILAEDESVGLLLLEDLGDATYTRLLASGANEAALYQLAVDLLIDLQDKPLPAGLVRYDQDRLLAEAMLLIDWYAPAIGCILDAPTREEYQAAWSACLPLADRVPSTLVLRDFHVDNLMRVEGRTGLAACGLLDFQDAVFGPVTYDLVSLLEDARRDVSSDVKRTLQARYLKALPAIAEADFAASWACLAAQRHAKVIGIFTRLARRDGKPGYLRHLPRVLGLLEAALTHPGLARLAEWFTRHLPPAQRIVPDP